MTRILAMFFAIFSLLALVVDLERVSAFFAILALTVWGLALVLPTAKPSCSRGVRRERILF